MALDMEQRVTAWPEGSGSLQSFVRVKRPLGEGAIKGAFVATDAATGLPAGLLNEADRLGPDYYKG